MAWVVKNKDGSETIYEVKPYKLKDEWVSREDGWKDPINTLIFHKVVSKSSLEENYLGMMSQ